MLRRAAIFRANEESPSASWIPTIWSVSAASTILSKATGIHYSGVKIKYLSIRPGTAISAARSSAP